MSIFDSLGSAQHTPNTQPTHTQQTPNAQRALESLKSNPRRVLEQAGLNIPDGMNDPQQIVNHLLQSGQVSNPRLQMAQRMMGMLGRR